MKKNLLLLVIVVNSTLIYSQKDEKFKLEEVKKQCANLPLESRVRLSVTRFSVTTATNDVATTTNTQENNTLKKLSIILGSGSDAPVASKIPPVLGDNLSTMLTNALQGVNCYRVLESLSNNEDLTKEVDAGNGKYSSKNTPKAGKQLGAQIVVTGEVIEYSIKEKGGNVLGVGSKKKRIKMGFNLKMINPETRDIIASHVFRVESRAEKSVSVLGLVSSSDSDPAVAAVMEDGVIQAVEYMAKMRDSLNLTANGQFAGNTGSGTNGSNDTEIILKNANYTSFTAFASMIADITGYKSMEKSLDDGIGIFTITHTGSSDTLLDELNKKIGSKYEVTGFSKEKIELKVK